MYLHIKRIIDIVCSILAITAFAIPMSIVAIAIKNEDGDPIIYKSKRTGKDGKEFCIYKFRSMTTKRKELDNSLSHDQMVTKVGKFIRKTSLDELPQLFNILKGDMSFIGPRPWIPEYYENFTEEQKRRCEVLPGLTGLAQAKGRNGIDIFQKINYDIEYVENQSFTYDMKILLLTVASVLSKEDAEITECGIQDEIQALKNQDTKLTKTRSKERNVVSKINKANINERIIDNENLHEVLSTR